MTNKMQYYQSCVNSTLINNYHKAQDSKDQALEYVCEAIIYIFRDQLETCECQEDINDDLSFEIQYMIERDSYDTTTKEVLKCLYSDFDIKEYKDEN